MYASKAMGAWYIQCLSAIAPLEARLLFSSVGAGLGYMGQGTYAAGNACLDAHAISRRARGTVSCSLQWPLVGGAGMGALTIAGLAARQSVAAGMAEVISLEDYAVCLKAQLMVCLGVASSVQIAHYPNVHGLLQDLADRTEPRFGELEALAKHIPIDVGPVMQGTAPAGGAGELAASLVKLEPSQRQSHVEAFVLSAVRELAGAPAASLTTEMPLMEAGVDSLAEAELRTKLQNAADIALPTTLLVDFPTTSQLAAAVASAPRIEPSFPEAAVISPVGKGVVSQGEAQPLDGAAPAALNEHDEQGPAPTATQHLRTKRHRALMLHGRAADGALMEKLLTALGWAALQIDFVTITALHQCDLRPDLYPPTVTFPNGAFDWGMNFEGPYKAEGVNERVGCVLQSVEDIEQILATDSMGFDGLGGICDGSIIASVVAARLPARSSVCFYINMCGGPWDMLPESLRMEKMVTIPSLHLLGKKDELFTWDQLSGIPGKCVNPLIVMHGAGHAVPIVSKKITNAVLITLQEADVLAAEKLLLPVDDASTGETETAQVGAGGGRLNEVATSPKPKGPMGAEDIEYDSLALLNGPAEPVKKPPLAHLTGLRGVFIMMVVLLHFVPRPYENVGTTTFVDNVDIAKGWKVQDLANKLIDRIPPWGMPYLFIASGFGLQLTYRKKKGHSLLDFYLDRLTRMMNMLWLVIFVEFSIDRFVPAKYQPWFQPGHVPMFTYIVNVFTLGAWRPLIQQAHNVLHYGENFPNVGYITPTTSETMNVWLSKHGMNIPTVLHLWFLSYTVMCVVSYPLMVKMINYVDRVFGILGLACFVLISTLVAMIPMLVDKGEVLITIEGSTFEMGQGKYRDDSIAPFWTDEPWKFWHYEHTAETLAADPAEAQFGRGTRLLATEWLKGKKPQYRLPWFLDEPSAFWPFGYMLWFACGVATVNFMVRVEAWGRDLAAREAMEAKEDEATESKTMEMDIESGKSAKLTGSRPPTWRRILRRICRLHLSAGKAFVSHQGRGYLADLCILSMILPSLWFDFNYTKATNGYLNKYGWNEVSNWNKAAVPIMCLFLYGSASEGGAGYFASILASDQLVALGDISLAVYAFQATVARICGVRWVLRGRNQDDYCRDQSAFFKDLPGRLTGAESRMKVVGIVKDDVTKNCINASGEQVTLLLVILIVFSGFVTYKVEPILDEKFRQGVGYIREGKKRVGQLISALCYRGTCPPWRPNRDGERERLISADRKET